MLIKNASDFGVLIREVRNTAGLTQTALAERIGVSRQWLSEVEAMRNRIHAMREGLVETLAAKGVTQDFSFIARQCGMFSFTGLGPEQVDRLRTEHSIYIVRSGRINVAGINRGNLDRLCTAIASVL